MGQNSSIQWTDHTFNPWWGCEKVSTGCKNCYAEAFAMGRMRLSVWGAQAERRMFGDKHWNEPLNWDRAAERAGARARVFCASMADVFEDYQGPQAQQIRDARFRLLTLIAKTPHLDWLLLTKRPENIAKLWPSHLPGVQFYGNIWIGCTVENQEMAEKRIPLLLNIPAAVRFVSYEPALGPVVFSPWLPGIDWIIVGGESGNGARPFNPAWANEAVMACQKARVPVFVKQMGSNPSPRDGSAWGPIRSKKGDHLEEWPECLRVREIPRT